MKFFITRQDQNPLRDKTADALTQYLLKQGNRLNSNSDGVSFILNLTDPKSPRPGRRNSQAVFIVSIVAVEDDPKDLRSYCYQTLVRTLSNLLIAVHFNRETQREEVLFTTPEAGYYAISSAERNGSCAASKIYDCVLPIVSAHYLIENSVSVDLPERLVNGSVVVEEMRNYSKELDNLGVMPLPFPLNEVLSPRDRRHLYHIYGMTGLSYGNLSAREYVPELGEGTFWMTGRGVDKRNLPTIGKDILLVKGVDHASSSVLISSPEGYDPKARVSIDAVEHEMIYRSFPEVGAIMHVHAWMDGVRATKQNFPCGTRELAEEVVGLLKQTDNPKQAVVGLKNHGLTITGTSLAEIFDRVRGRLLTEVPMFS